MQIKSGAPRLRPLSQQRRNPRGVKNIIFLFDLAHARHYGQKACPYWKETKLSILQGLVDLIFCPQGPWVKVHGDKIEDKISNLARYLLIVVLCIWPPYPLPPHSPDFCLFTIDHTAASVFRLAGPPNDPPARPPRLMAAVPGQAGLPNQPRDN